MIRRRDFITLLNGRLDAWNGAGGRHGAPRYCGKAGKA
jgi:hypothetical protein